MKVAYFGNDWHIGCLDVFKQSAHTIGHIFINGEQTFNQVIRQYATDNNIPVTCIKPDEEHIKNLIEQGFECFFSVEYAWLIPIPEDMKTVYAMNVHPSMLPHGRGTTPVSWIINAYPQYAGVTFHKLTSEFDKGDIIYQKPMTLAVDESFETWMVKLHLSIPLMLNEILVDFEALYLKAHKQEQGSTWPKISINDRVINWNMTTQQIKALAACCGRFGIVAMLNNETLLVNNIEVGQIKHEYKNGTVIKEDSETYVVAVSDGFVILMKHNIIEQI
ncbi:formyltransferase family protein [Pseudoalteromonas denitrificans]|uniref:Methionyl-tRNA formyltransferase n=1 Tax=Pseudoalteromonas denitrificans DSM 6059 TaxID=1123010 RepID=A0A1I1IRF2_9GAMM|nr:formyltransferase family protein [Pseudoalteromonas denitrificans]SFC38521.1 methionyl-tRNA formyltransferase [Pseudoalteromonas denitrificans DSM 6059]